MKICIIGGGMAGIICAITAAANPENKITIYERQSSIGKKIAITGNGKCNLSNINVRDVSRFSSFDTDILKSLASDFDNDSCQAFYESIGIHTTYSRGGMYPLCGHAGSVVTMLNNRISELGVRVVTDIYIDNIKESAGSYIVNNEKYDAVVLAFGGKAGIYGENSSCGIEIIKGLELTGVRPSPALTGIICKGDMKAVSGVRTHATVSLYDGDTYIYSDEGELQLADNGLSGIPIFNLTNHLPYNMGSDNDLKIHVDFAPEIIKEKLLGIFSECKKSYPDRSMSMVMLGIMNGKLAGYILETAGIDGDKAIKNMDDNAINNLVDLIKNHVFIYDSLRNYKNAQVMRGGVRLTEITGNYESKNYPSIFMIGEMLDISGECGGYNLYFAYHSGRSVGQVLAGMK